MPNKLFIYGTLGPGRSNAHIMEPIKGTWQKAFVKGKLYEEGWGAAMGYPAITLDKEGDKVKGYLFTSEQIETYWARLDEFEGEGYERVLTQVELENGDKEEAFIYALKQ